MTDLKTEIIMLRAALSAFVNVYSNNTDPGIADLDDEQPVSWHVSLGAYRNATRLLAVSPPVEETRADDALLASIEVTMKLEDDILACRTASDLRAMQITIQRRREADVSLFDRAVESAKAHIAAPEEPK